MKTMILRILLLGGYYSFASSVAAAASAGGTKAKTKLKIATEKRYHHADHFYGTVPVCRALTPNELNEDYEKNTGIVIVKHFAENDINPYEIPGVIQLHHAPFTWGGSALKSLDNSIALETCAKMAIDSWKVSPELPVIPQYILDKHFLRKHGPDSYYGQKSNDQEGP